MTSQKYNPTQNDTDDINLRSGADMIQQPIVRHEAPSDVFVAPVGTKSEKYIYDSCYDKTALPSAT